MLLCQVCTKRINWKPVHVCWACKIQIEKEYNMLFNQTRKALYLEDYQLHRFEKLKKVYDPEIVPRFDLNSK